MNGKKALSFALAFLLGFPLMSCGEYKPAKPGGSSDSEQSESGSSDSSHAEFKNPSTVSLYYYVNGKRMPYTNATKIDAIWTGEGSVNKASFDKNGVATVDELDGDYQVTLSGLPEGYTYNPNAHRTTNDQRDIEVDIYELVIPKGKGTDMYRDYIQLNQEVKNAANPYVYRVTVKDENSRVHCQFHPTSNGVYSIESWVDVTEQKINPKIDVYNGSFAYKVFSHTLDDGGVSQGYTSNFKHEVKITDEERGNDFSFAVYAGVKNDAYPVTVDFVVQCDGDWIVDKDPPTLILHQPLEAQADYSAAEYEMLISSEASGKGSKIFDGKKFRFNEETGYYHVYDEEKYRGYTEWYADESSATFADGYGPILYMRITKSLDPFILPHEGTPISFENVEDIGNRALVLSATENYELFIRGYDTMTDRGYDCLINLSEEERKKYEGYKGYASFVNSDGLYGVTEELKVFAQKYSIKEHMFADGEGTVEYYGYDAIEEDQWLFACMYYEKK